MKIYKTWFLKNCFAGIKMGTTVGEKAVDLHKAAVEIKLVTPQPHQNSLSDADIARKLNEKVRNLKCLHL